MTNNKQLTGWLQKYDNGGELPNIIPTDNLKTFNFGGLAGKKQTNNKNKSIHNNIINAPDIPMADEGESWNEATNRVVPTLENIIQNSPANTTLVTHNSVFGLINLWDKQGRPNEFSKEQREKYTKQDGSFKTGDSFSIEGNNGPIHIVRHGETTDNQKGNFRSDDTELTRKGVKQASSIGEKLSSTKIPQIISSSLDRAIATSDIIASLQEDKKKPEELKNGGWLERYSNGGDNYGQEENANISNVSIPPNFVGMSNDTSGRNYSPAWGGQFAMGGNIPGSVGFTYARTGDIPSNGKYAKKTKASAENGTEMRYYQNGLDYQPKNISQDGSTNPYQEMASYNPIPKDIAKTKEDYGVYGIIPSPMKAYQFEKSYRDVQNNDLNRGDIQLTDNRNVPDNQKFNHAMNKDVVTSLIQGAKQRGLNPSTVLAIALAEQGGKGLNPLNDNSQNLESYNVMKNYATKYPEGITSSTVIGESLDSLVKKNEYAKSLGKTNEADIIQGWNGYGTVEDMYGVKGKTNMSENPLYGKRIIDLRNNVINKNPQLKSMLNMKQGGQLTKLDQLTNFSNFGESKTNWLQKYV